MKKISGILLVAVVLLGTVQVKATGCREERSLPFFNKIEMRSLGHVHVRLGNEQSVYVEADDDIIAEVKTRVKGEILEIYLDDGFPEYLVDPEIDIYVVMKEVKGLELLGVGKISSEGILKAKSIELKNGGLGSVFISLESEKVFTELSGLGKITLEGKADYNEYHISGAGKIDARYFEVKEALVKSSGIGTCDVFATKPLDVDISGIGKVNYRGNPEVRRKITGIGNLEEL